VIEFEGASAISALGHVVRAVEAYVSGRHDPHLVVRKEGHCAQCKPLERLSHTSRACRYGVLCLIGWCVCAVLTHVSEERCINIKAGHGTLIKLNVSKPIETDTPPKTQQLANGRSIPAAGLGMGGFAGGDVFRTHEDAVDPLVMTPTHCDAHCNPNPNRRWRRSLQGIGFSVLLTPTPSYCQPHCNPDPNPRHGPAV